MSHLIADIGATHARFTVHGREPTGDGVLVLPTARYERADALVRDAVRALDASPVLGGCFAVAGPVTGGRVSVTNGGLTFDEAMLGASLGWPVRLVNDFYALAVGLPGLSHLEQLGGDAGLAAGRGVKAVIGPGSGLGMAMVVPTDDGGSLVLASEGGHADLAPGNHLEQEVLSLMQAAHGSVCWETVVSGPGLVRLYRAVATLWGTEPRALGPEDVSREGVDAEDPVCHQTLEMFFGLLGAAAGNLALTVCARGGVYIGGGIVPGLAAFARTSPLRRRFDERTGLEAFAAEIPLFLILDRYPGLVGAGACLDESGTGGE